MIDRQTILEKAEKMLVEIGRKIEAEIQRRKTASTEDADALYRLAWDARKKGPEGLDLEEDISDIEDPRELYELAGKQFPERGAK